MELLILLGRAALAGIFIVVGAMHFTKTKYFLGLMPPYIPWHKAAVLVSGVAEVLLGVALWVPELAHLAAWGMIAFLILVMPVHVYMAQHPAKFPAVSKVMLYGRLAFQFVFIAWAYAYTQL